MKFLATVLLSVMLMPSCFAQPQEPNPEADRNDLSNFDSYVRSKSFEEAYQPWKSLRERNPRYHLSIYTSGEKILEYKIDKSSGADKKAFLEDLLGLYDQRIETFESKTKVGDILSKKAQVMYDYKDDLGCSDTQIFTAFNNAYNTDAATFTNPKALYTFFKVVVRMYDSNEKSAEDLFTVYDEISEKIEDEVKRYTKLVNKFVPQKGGEEVALSSKDERVLVSYNSYLNGYELISEGMDKDLGDRANCENLIPLYNKNYEANKNDGVWLQRAMNRLGTKGCEDPLFIKIVEQKNSLEPNADTAYYLGILKDKEGASSEALAYYNQAVELESDDYAKAKILFKVATNFKSKRSYSNARMYYRKALQFNPSMGKAYLAVAQMYASSANDCGDDNFSKRAVYWLAADEARKAGKVDSNLAKAAAQTAENYLSKAPQTSEIFTSGRDGEVIRIGCWINSSVTVPKL